MADASLGLLGGNPNYWRVQMREIFYLVTNTIPVIC